MIPDVFRRHLFAILPISCKMACTPAPPAAKGAGAEDTYGCETRYGANMAEEFLTLMADLDDESQLIMNGWYEKLQAEGFSGEQTSGLPFHISLACFSLDKEQEALEEMKALANRFSELPVHISHIGLFAGGRVLFAAPDMNPSGLLQLRQAIKTEACERFPWTPHCKIIFEFVILMGAVYEAI